MDALGTLLGRSWTLLGARLRLRSEILASTWPPQSILERFGLQKEAPGTPKILQKRSKVVKFHGFLVFGARSLPKASCDAFSLALGSLLGAPEASWRRLGPSWALLGRSWDPLGRSWGALGTFLDALGTLLDALGRSWALLAALGALLGRSWLDLGTSRG